MQTLLFLSFWFRKLPSRFQQEVSATEYKVLKVALFLAIEKIAEFVGKIFGSSEEKQSETETELLDVKNPPPKEKVEKMSDEQKEKYEENAKVTNMMRNGKLNRFLSNQDTDVKAQKYQALGFFDRIAENKKERLAEEAAKRKK